MDRHFNVRVYGQVQGVNFRTESKRLADRLNITGFVRNEPDGGIYLEAEGGREDLEKFIEWCKKGTDWSKVERIEVSEGELKNYRDYIIQYA